MKPKLDPRFAGIVAAALLSSGFAAEDEPTAARTIRVGTIVTVADISAPQTEAGLREAATLVGLEAARTIFKGEPVSRDYLRAPTLVARNGLVSMEFLSGGLVITTEGRALEDGGAGALVRVMNLSSKRIVPAVVVAANTVRTKQ